MNRRTATPKRMRQAGPATRRERPNSAIDAWVLSIVVALVMIGLVMVYAATYHHGINHLKWQLARAGLGLLAMLLGMRFRHGLVAGRFGKVVVYGTLGLLVATLALGRSVGVATRWWGLLQPAELAKFVLPMGLAAYFAELRERPTEEWTFRNTVSKPGLLVVVFLGVVLLQPAIGTTVIMALSALAIFFVVGVRLRYLIPIVLAAALLVGVTIRLHPYARRRVEEFMTGERYQQRQSLIAIGSGGPFGRGLGEGKQKFYFLPKLHTDFIIAAAGEEFGFVGSLVIFALYGGLLVCGAGVARRANSQFGQFLASGIVITMFIYATVHMAVALGLVPPTGQPLPFISFGGSALVSNLFAAGVLLNISRFQRRPDEGVDGRRWDRRARLSRAGAR